MVELNKVAQNLIIKKIDSETKNIQIINNDILMSVVGQFDQNLKNYLNLLKLKYILEAIQLHAKVITKIHTIFAKQ